MILLSILLLLFFIFFGVGAWYINTVDKKDIEDD